MNSKSLSIYNLTNNVSEEHLREIFGNFGILKEVLLLSEENQETRIVSNNNTTTDRYNNIPCAKIKYENEQDAERAKECMDGGQIDGKFISIKLDGESNNNVNKRSKDRKRRRRKRSSSSSSSSSISKNNSIEWKHKKDHSTKLTEKSETKKDKRHNKQEREDKKDRKEKKKKKKKKKKEDTQKVLPLRHYLQSVLINTNGILQKKVQIKYKNDTKDIRKSKYIQIGVFKFGNNI